MHRSLDQVLGELRISRQEMELYLAESWVLPERRGEELAFEEVDLARLRLIAELRRDFDVNDEAVPLVLHLVDELHLLRQCLAAIGEALVELPAEQRSRIEKLIERSFGPR